METKLRVDGVEFSIFAEKSLKKLIEEYFISTDDKSDIYRKINIHYRGFCGCSDYKTDCLLMVLKNYMDVEYQIYESKADNIISYISDDDTYGRHVYRKISENDYEVYSIDKSEKNGMQWVIRLIRELLLETHIEDGFVPVHASGIDIDGEAVLFIGNKGSGKTTSMFACANNGKSKIVSNDMVFLKTNDENISIKGWPWCVTVGNELIAETKFKHLINKDSKVRFTPKEFRDSVKCEWTWKTKLKKVVFPKIVVDKKLETSELDNEVVKTRLINEGTEYSDITLVLKMKTIELDFIKPFTYIANNAKGIVVEGDFWKYKEEFFSYM